MRHCVDIGDEKEDYALPIWSARYPVKLTPGAAEACPRQHRDAAIPPEMRPYQPGRALDEILTEAYQANYPSDG